MSVTNLDNGTTEEIISGNDNIVIMNVSSTIVGGRSLDVTGFPKTVIHAGHVIIRETATKEYKPMPLNEAGNAYAALPDGHTYAGVLIASVKTSRPFAGIMESGKVNQAASEFSLATILAAVKTALPLIIFTEDKY